MLRRQQAARSPVVLAAQPFLFCTTALRPTFINRVNLDNSTKQRNTWGSPRLGSPHVIYSRNVRRNTFDCKKISNPLLLSHRAVLARELYLLFLGKLYRFYEQICSQILYKSFPTRFSEFLKLTGLGILHYIFFGS